ncbi:hypothetical protein Micbo1qcDRAFT_232049 [Microdochium bolleyi]|uniref:Protein HRI1 n=1 Tax=Microdochium bolleyi TaxID=196109 RepID=A0A136JBQ1_9PEZI|nr:hypothetical protein Micbo1qcDRAFT_232049 [Microdochium bolleyi]
MGSISIRRSVQWLPDDPAPSEPTSTVVLTSPGRRFVDIRILLPGGGGGRVVTGDELLAAAHRDFGTITTENLDWAFCGTSESAPAAGDAPEGTTHSKWHHLVSDRAPDVSHVTDEGDMAPHPSGDGSVLETGRMVNPATGRDTAYEEVWVDGEPQTIPPWMGNVGGGGGGGGGEESRKCVVLEARGEEGPICGMVVCLGRFCQGVVRRGQRFGLERWSSSSSSSAGRWEQRARLDSGLWIPAREVLERAGRLEVGDVVAGKSEGVEEEGEVKWTVVEAC